MNERQQNEMAFTFGEQCGEIGIGSVHETVVDDRTGEAVIAGESIVQFDSPEPNRRVEPTDDTITTMRVTTGIVDKIAKMDRDGSPAIFIAGGPRVSMEDIKTGTDVDRTDRFLNANTENSITETWRAPNPLNPNGPALSEITEYEVEEN